MDRLVARLLVCKHTRQISPDLIDAVLEALLPALPLAIRRAHQWALLRQAADLLDGPPHSRARQLESIIARWSGRPSDPIRSLLYDAARCGLKLPQTARGIYNIIVSTEK